jgi:transposase-like protein
MGYELKTCRLCRQPQPLRDTVLGVAEDRVEQHYWCPACAASFVEEQPSETLPAPQSPLCWFPEGKPAQRVAL